MDDIVFFADEVAPGRSGSYERVLPAWFRSLAPTTEPDEWAETVVDTLNAFVRSDVDEILTAARDAGTPEQRAALAEWEGQLRRRR